MANTNPTPETYIPFTKRYVMHKILNYGKPYTNYTTYKPIENQDNIETIYVDNQNCNSNSNSNSNNYTQNHGEDISYQDISYYVEIHYTKASKKRKYETILKSHEIDILLEKYGNKV